MSKWKPGAAVASAGNSYLSNMSTSSTPAATAPAPAPYIPQYEQPFSTNVVEEKKSYSMTGWTPYTKVAPAPGGTGSYLDNMSAQKRIKLQETSEAPKIDLREEIPVAPKIDLPAPAIVSDTPKEYIAIRPPKGTSVPNVMGTKKSYSMTEWVPGDRVNTAAASTSASAYLSNMNLNRPALSPTYGPPTVTRESGGMAVMEKTSATTSTSAVSQSISPPPATAQSGRGAQSSYSERTASSSRTGGTGSSSRSSVAPYSPPTTPPPPAATNTGDYMANLGGGNNGSAKKNSYSKIE